MWIDRREAFELVHPEFKDYGPNSRQWREWANSLIGKGKKSNIYKKYVRVTSERYVKVNVNLKKGWPKFKKVLHTVQ